MDEEVCLLLCMKGSFFWLPQDDMTMDVDIVVSGNYCSVDCCFIAENVGWWHLLKYRKFDFCSLTYV